MAAKMAVGTMILGDLFMNSMKFLPQDTAIDPNMFALNWDVVFEVLVTIVLLAFILERALAVLFESHLFVQMDERRGEQGKGSYKPLIAFVLAAVGCIVWQFDALSITLLKENVTILGAIITGGVVAGGSKGAMKLFHDVMDVKSGSYRNAEPGTDTDKTQE